MERRKRNGFLVAGLGGMLLGVLLLLLLQLAQGVWRAAAESDAGRRGVGVKDRLMQRKADALQDVLDALVRGRLERIEPAAERMIDYTAAIEGYLDTDVYRRYGADYLRALEELREAAGREDRAGARAAFGRLENACLECHFLLDGSP